MIGTPEKIPFPKFPIKINHVIVAILICNFVIIGLLSYFLFFNSITIRLASEKGDTILKKISINDVFNMNTPMISAEVERDGKKIFTNISVNQAFNAYLEGLQLIISRQK